MVQLLEVGLLGEKEAGLRDTSEICLECVELYVLSGSSRGRVIVEVPEIARSREESRKPVTFLKET